MNTAAAAAVDKEEEKRALNAGASHRSALTKPNRSVILTTLRSALQTYSKSIHRHSPVNVPFYFLLLFRSLFLDE